MMLSLTLFFVLMFAPLQGGPCEKGIIEVGEIGSQNTVILDDGSPF